MQEPIQTAEPPKVPQSSEAVPTRLADLLREADPDLSLETCRGRKSPSHFGDPTAELQTLLHSVGLSDLGFRTRISVTGPDRFRWLNGMVTNAVAALPAGEGNYNFILNAQGRIQGDAYIFQEPDRLIVETDIAQAPRLVEHFDRFIIMDDVELAPLTDTALAVTGPDAPALLQRLGVAEAATLEPLQSISTQLNGEPVTLIRAFAPPEAAATFHLWFAPAQTGAIYNLLHDAGAIPTGLTATNALRILQGTPVYGIDIHDRNLVQETSQTRALNFTKGCYLGQEIVERIRSRTTVHRFLRQFSLGGVVPPPGAELRSPGQDRPVGQLTSIATYNLPGLPPTLALGYIRGENIDRHLPVEYDGGTATLLDKPPNG